MAQERPTFGSLPRSARRTGTALLTALGLCALSAAQANTATRFGTQQTFATGTGPHSVIAADLNGDGKRDLIVTNQTSATVSVFLNTAAVGAATAAFAAQQGFATGADPVSVIAVDINGDGKLDLVVANAQSSTVSVLLNTTAAGATTASFATQQTFATGPYPFSVAAADLDGDGKLDLVVANVGTTSISVLRNTTPTGSSTASFATQQLFSAGPEPSSIAIADINGDGKPDVIVANYTGVSASVLLNTTATGASTLSFGAPQPFAAGNGPSFVAAADLNGDGKPDVVVVNSYDYTISVLINTTAAQATTATFADQQLFITGPGPAAVAVADVDGDGKLDLVIPNQSNASLSVLLNSTTTGSATANFVSQQTFKTGIDPVGAAVADVNGDGLPDLIAANSQDATISVLLNTPITGVNLNQHGITGSWYNPVTSGQGLEIEMYPNFGSAGQALFFGGWFTYDTTSSGGQRWYALEGGVDSSHALGQLGIYTGYSGNFAAAPAITATQVGTATVLFPDCGDGILTYSFFDGRTGTIPLSRLTGNVTCSAAGDSGAASDYLLSGSWFDATTSGQGLVFDVNPAQSLLFAAWYTYAPNGATISGGASQSWFVIQAAFTPGTAATAATPIYTDSGGIFDDPTVPTPAPVGTATITFQSCTAATLQYSFTSGTNSGKSGTLNLTRTGPTPAGCSL